MRRISLRKRRKICNRGLRGPSVSGKGGGEKKLIVESGFRSELLI